MVKQNLILQTLRRPESLARVQAISDAAGATNRTEVARRICAEFEFFDSWKRPQVTSCLKALRALESKGLICIPAPRASPHLGARREAQAADPVPAPAPFDVPSSVELVRGLEIVPAVSPHQRQLCQRLIACEHPRGAVRHVGAQMRYLIISDHGILGAAVFAASALALRERDQWIGWNRDTRLRHLHRIVGLSRYLVRPAVHCKNLASKALSLCLRRLPADFEQRYNYCPWLVETFADTSQNSGTCFRAANFTYVGCTAGRGRFTPRGTQVPLKRIFLRPLNPRWRRLLNVSGPPPKPVPEPPEPPDRGPLGPADGLRLDQWAQNEFGGAPLGDVRLGRRLVRSASVQSAKPMASFPRAAESDMALIRGHYRLIDKPAQSAVTVENILAPHRERTLRRMRGQQTVLLVQDGTDLHFAEHSAGKGMGVIGKHQHSQDSVGLHMHSTLAISEDGLSLGVTRITFDRPAQDGQPERVKPVEERQTGRWLRGLRDSAELVAGVEDRPQVVAVLDREGDAFALFRDQGQLDGVELLVRARHNRVLDPGGAELFDKLRAAPAQATLQIQVDRQSARRQRAREARRAVVGLRWQTVRLPAPDTDSEALEMQAVHVHEREQPETGSRLEWLLLTTCAVDSQADVERVLGWYRQRRRIEDWQRALKSGCKLELLQHRSVERIERAVAIRAVIAWRLMMMTLVGRQTPKLPADLLFTEIELMVLRDFARDRKLPTPDNVGQAVRTMAMMGGYLNRKGDPPSGHQKLWEGHTDLAAEARCYGRILRMGENSSVLRKLVPG